MKVDRSHLLPSEISWTTWREDTGERKHRAWKKDSCFVLFLFSLNPLSPTLGLHVRTPSGARNGGAMKFSASERFASRTRNRDYRLLCHLDQLPHRLCSSERAQRGAPSTVGVVSWANAESVPREPEISHRGRWQWAQPLRRLPGCCCHPRRHRETCFPLVLPGPQWRIPGSCLFAEICTKIKPIKLSAPLPGLLPCQPMS